MGAGAGGAAGGGAGASSRVKSEALKPSPSKQPMQQSHTMFDIARRCHAELD
jgi:hypothetical protein